MTTTAAPPVIRTRPLLGVAMMVAGGTLFAVNGTVAKLVMRAGLDPQQLTGLRATGAFLGLLVLCLATRPARLKVRRTELPLLVVFGLVGFFLVPMLYFIAIGRLGVGIGLLFEYTAPVLVALWARFGQRRPVRARLWVGLVLCLGGLAMVAEVGRAGGIRLDGLGVLAALASAVGLAVYFLVGEHGYGTTRRDLLSMTCWAFGVAALAGAVVRPWWAFPFAVLGERSAGVPVWLLVSYVVVLGSIVPYLLVAGSLRHLPATSVGIVGMTEPVIAGAVAWVALDEVLSIDQLAGAALVLAGVGLAETARAGRRE